MLTAGYTINLVAPVVGDRLVTRAVVVSAGQRLITARCELIEPHPERDRVCAIAQGTIADRVMAASAGDRRLARRLALDPPSGHHRPPGR